VFCSICEITKELHGECFIVCKLRSGWKDWDLHAVKRLRLLSKTTPLCDSGSKNLELSPHFKAKSWYVYVHHSVSCTQELSKAPGLLVPWRNWLKAQHGSTCSENFADTSSKPLRNFIFVPQKNTHRTLPGYILGAPSFTRYSLLELLWRFSSGFSRQTQSYFTLTLLTILLP